MPDLTALPYVLDRPTATVQLPGVSPAQFEPARAVGITAACALIRGRGGRPLHVQVARRWASRRPGAGWHVTVGGVRYALRLPTVKLGGELLTMPAWVRAFEDARARLSAVL